MAERRTRQEKARRKLLRLFDRKQLEEFSERENPWHADRATLETEALARWPHEDIAAALDKLVEDAR